ncbi:MAG: YfhO family protein [Ignavibacteriales bacterium]|nr:YfhO family protein [Ignavibacteriales bacterium]
MNEGFPYRYSMSQSLQSGNLPLWISEIYGGFPLLARAEAGICYPINLLLFGLLSPWVALNIVILLTIITAGISAYLYVREIGGNLFSAIASGIAFALSGYLLSHLKHLSNVNAACWLPLGLYFIERAIKRNDNRNLVWFGLIFGLQHLSGHTQVAYYSGVTYLCYFIFRYIRQQKELLLHSNKSAKHIAQNVWLQLFQSKLSWSFIGMLIIGSLLGAIQLIPTYELVSLSQRSGGVTFDYASNYAYDPKNLGMFLYPYINGDIGNDTYKGNSIFWEDYGYVGLIVLLLALHASFRLWKNWYVKFFTTSTLVSIMLVLGPNTPIYEFVFNFVPGMKFFRFPTRFLLITDLSLIVLAGLGFTDFINRFVKKNPKDSTRTAEIVLLCLVIADLLLFQLRQNPIVEAEEWLNPPKSVEMIKQDTSWYRIFCIGGNQAHTLTFQKARGWEGDLQPFIDQREFIQPSSNVLYGLSTPNGYANLTPNYIVDTWGDQNRPGAIMKTGGIQGDKFLPTPIFWRLMNMYNVKYLSSLWQIAPQEGIDAIGKFGDAFFYRNNNFMPRAYLVSSITLVSNNNQAINILFSQGFDPQDQAILFEMPEDFHSSDTVNGKVNLIRYSPNDVDFEVQSEKEAILIFSDSYYPGWIAEIDGKESKIYQANVTQRAVVVPAGSHRVEFKFRPKTVFIGFWLTILGGLIILASFILTKNKSSKVE